MTNPDGTTSGKDYGVLVALDPEQTQKLKDAIDELVRLFKVFTVTIPSEKFENFLLNSMVEYQQNSSPTAIGSVSDLRGLLIKSSKRLVEYARQTQEFSADWEDNRSYIGIEDDVMKIIDKYF